MLDMFFLCDGVFALLRSYLPHIQICFFYELDLTLGESLC